MDENTNTEFNYGVYGDGMSVRNEELDKTYSKSSFVEDSGIKKLPEDFKLYDPEPYVISFKPLTMEEQAQFLKEDAETSAKWMNKITHPRDLEDTAFTKNLIDKWFASQVAEKIEKIEKENTIQKEAEKRAHEIVREINKTPLQGVIVHYINVSGLDSWKAELEISRVKEHSKKVFRNLSLNYEQMFLPVLSGNTRVEILRIDNPAPGVVEPETTTLDHAKAEALKY